MLLMPVAASSTVSICQLQGLRSNIKVGSFVTVVFLGPLPNSYQQMLIELPPPARYRVPTTVHCSHTALLTALRAPKLWCSTKICLPSQFQGTPSPIPSVMQRWLDLLVTNLQFKIWACYWNNITHIFELWMPYLNAWVIIFLWFISPCIPEILVITHL